MAVAKKTMFSAALSRRAANAMQAPSLADPTVRQPFVRAVEAASTFEQLPARWQQVIEQAERELAKLQGAGT